MKRYMISYAMFLLLLGGCSNKEEMAFDDKYHQNIPYYVNLQKTEKAQLYEDEKSKAILTATYLYRQSTDSGDDEDEKFIVSFYIENGDTNLLTQEYNLSLAGVPPKSIHPIPKESKALETIAFVTEWNSYYLVTFPHTSEKSFNLILESKRYGKAQMHFAKVAKYSIGKKAD